jgi:hypothetical protein
MAIYKIFPEKDSTIYSGFTLKNTGIDEILEISTFYNTTSPEVSRALVKFSQDEIEYVVLNIISGSTTNANGDSIIGSASFESDLKLYIADIRGLNATTELEVFAVSQSYNMGTGKYSNKPETTNGVGWTFKNSSGSGAWKTSSFPSFSTGSFSGSNGGGGTWYTGSTAGLSVTESQTLSYSSDKDLKINVTNYVNTWVSNSFNASDGFSNDGFIIKQSDSDEFIADKNYVTSLKYFSVDTNTIYPPQLEFKFRDALFSTGSSTLTTISTSRLVASLDNNSNTYRSESVAKMRVNCRPQFPTRVFQTSSIYTTNYFLPTSSFYAVKDLDTNEFVIDFNTDYTKLSQDESGSYFKLYMNGLQPERYYQILIKTNIGSETIILDDNYYFKVING